MGGSDSWGVKSEEFFVRYLGGHGYSDRVIFNMAADGLLPDRALVQKYIDINKDSQDPNHIAGIKLGRELLERQYGKATKSGE